LFRRSAWNGSARVLDVGQAVPMSPSQRIEFHMAALIHLPEWTTRQG
jgi:hypothetical protein